MTRNRIAGVVLLALVAIVLIGFWLYPRDTRDVTAANPALTGPSDPAPVTVPPVAPSPSVAQ